ncbi:MAG: restriction endonuclease subunit S [Candidatus Scalindua sp.]
MNEGYRDMELGELLDYIQPSKYIVKSTEYDDSYETPVLTPGKSFIKGYTNETEGIFTDVPVIIFDDFTTASKFVDFPFKVKSSAMKILVLADDEVDIKYLYYMMQVIQVRSDTHKRYWISVYAKKNLLTPPLPEQKRIVAEIEKQFSRLDEAVAALKRIKANLKRYKASVLKAAVEGKLTEEWRKEHPDVEPARELLKRILAERRRKWEDTELEKMRAKGKEAKDDTWKKKYKEPTVPKLDQYPHLPEGWTFTGIGQILAMDKDAMKTGPFGSLLKKHEHQPEGVPVLGIENIQAMRFVKGSKIHITKDKAQQLDGYCALPGDILISRSGTVGEVCVVPSDIDEARISTNLMKISLAKDGLLPEFFTFLFNGSPFVLNQVAELCKGSTRNFLNQEILRRIVFVLPTIEEQKEIIQAVDRQYTLLSKLEAEVDINLKRAERLRQSILRKAFSGKLFPQNPNDKPVESRLRRVN